MKDLKNLTSYAVETAMNLLIHTNGMTSTLEVKNLLRDQGYFATQDFVSIAMRETVLKNPDTYIPESNGSYIEYSFDEDGDLYFNYGIATTRDDTDDSDDDSNTVNVAGQIVNRDPIRIHYFESAIDDGVDGANNWCVFHKDMSTEFHIYNESLTRDQIRSKYASLVNVPIQDVRAKRVINFVNQVLTD